MKARYLFVIAAFAAIVFGAVQNHAQAATGCTDVPDIYTSSNFQMTKYFKATLTRDGSKGTATVTRLSTTPLCHDQQMVFLSFNLGPNWNPNLPWPENLASSMPQTLAHATRFTFGKDETTKVVTVEAPEACKPIQLDIYAGDESVANLSASIGAERIVQGNLFDASGACKKPHVSISKTVNNSETAVVARNEEFTYTLIAKNDGEVDLDSVVVSDIAQPGIQFVSAKSGSTVISVDGNKISYTTPRLAVGGTVKIDITAKATEYSDAPVVNTATVDTPTIPETNPDASDTASTTTPRPKQVWVCDTSDRTLKQVDETDKSKYASADSDTCSSANVCVVASGNTAMMSVYKDQIKSGNYSTNASDCKAKTPVQQVTSLPKTGPEAIIGSVAGVGALTYSLYLYIISRKSGM